MITKSTPSNVLFVRLAGTVNLENINQLKGEFSEKLRTNETIGVVVDLTEISDMTADAIAEDVKWELGLLDKIDRMPRMAVISDKQWVRAVQQFVDPMIQDAQMKVFAPNEVDAAIEFASDLPHDTNSKTTAGSITQLETGSETLLAFEMDGRIDSDALGHVIEPLQRAFDRGQKIDLLVRLKEYKGFDPKILLERSLFSMKFAAMSHVRRYAIVGAEGWMKKAIELFQPMTTIDMRNFYHQDEDDAWEWLRSE